MYIVSQFQLSSALKDLSLLKKSYAFLVSAALSTLILMHVTLIKFIHGELIQFPPFSFSVIYHCILFFYKPLVLLHAHLSNLSITINNKKKSLFDGWISIIKCPIKLLYSYQRYILISKAITNIQHRFVRFYIRTYVRNIQIDT